MTSESTSPWNALSLHGMSLEESEDIEYTNYPEKPLRFADGCYLSAAVIIGDDLLEARIDTASDKSLISKYLADELATAGRVIPMKIKVQLHDCSEHSVEEALLVNIKLGKKNCLLPLLILPKVRGELVVGTDFLLNIGTTLKIGSEKLELSNASKKIVRNGHKKKLNGNGFNELKRTAQKRRHSENAEPQKRQHSENSQAEKRPHSEDVEPQKRPHCENALSPEHPHSENAEPAPSLDETPAKNQTTEGSLVFENDFHTLPLELQNEIANIKELRSNQRRISCLRVINGKRYRICIRRKHQFVRVYNDDVSTSQQQVESAQLPSAWSAADAPINMPIDVANAAISFSNPILLPNTTHFQPFQPLFPTNNVIFGVPNLNAAASYQDNAFGALLAAQNFYMENSVLAPIQAAYNMPPINPMTTRENSVLAPISTAYNAPPIHPITTKENTVLAPIVADDNTPTTNPLRPKEKIHEDQYHKLPLEIQSTVDTVRGIKRKKKLRFFRTFEGKRYCINVNRGGGSYVTCCLALERDPESAETRTSEDESSNSMQIDESYVTCGLALERDPESAETRASEDEPSNSMQTDLKSSISASGVPEQALPQQLADIIMKAKQDKLPEERLGFHCDIDGLRYIIQIERDGTEYVQTVKLETTE